jgi:hypothetical protein
MDRSCDGWDGRGILFRPVWVLPKWEKALCLRPDARLLQDNISPQARVATRFRGKDAVFAKKKPSPSNQGKAALFCGRVFS